VGKRTAIISVIILISGLAILGYFFQQGRKSLLTDPYRVISPEACIVIAPVDLQSFFNSLTTGKGLFGEVGKIKEFDTFNRKVKFLADQMNKPAYRNILDGSKALISFQLTDSEGIHSLLSLAVTSSVKLRQIREALRSSGISTITQTSLLGNAVLGLPYTIEKQKDTVYIANISGLLLCASTSGVMKEAIAQTIRENDVRDAPGFSRVLQASGKKEDKIFIVFENLSGLLKSAFKNTSPVSAPVVGTLAGSAGGDIYISDNGLVISGYTESDNPKDILHRYKSGNAALFTTYKILPSATGLFESIVFDPAEPGKTPVNTVPMAAAELARKMREYTGDEITRAYIDIRDKSVSENSLIIYELKNRVYAEKIFLDEFSTTIDKENIFHFQPDDQINIPVYLTPYKGYASAFIPGYTGEQFDSWFAFYDNYLITGGSYLTISRMLYDNLLNKTLANDLTYRDFETTLPSISGYFFYCVPSRITGYLSRFFSDDIVKILRANKNSLGKIQAAGYQFTPSNNMIYNSLSVRFKDEVREVSVTEWETLLDTVAAIKPFFFTNHLTGAREIFIQDMKNNAYLVNAAGRVLWKVPLRERIRSTIYMIDYFRNGKFQLLFSGKNFLHLLDRNGNYVERYPVRLRSPATNPVALFDYDNNNIYRLLIAGEDRMVYAYDRSGSVVKGWKPFRTGGTVSSEISWFRVSGKDYLVISDETSVYFLDRAGNKRLTLKEPVTKAVGSAMRLTSGTSPSVVCTSPDGTVQNIYFDGRVEKFSKRKFSDEHSFDIFDVDGDGFGEYIFIDKGILYLYDHNRSEMFTRKFGSDELGGPINFIFSATDRKIGVFDIAGKHIYLIDSGGKIMEGFPLRGESMFSIGKFTDSGEWHLIVGGTDRFLYNYKLETAKN
jgi:hypothetical protein